MSQMPPKLAQLFLLRFLRKDLAEEVQGDLDERFYSTLKNKSAFRAKLSYWYEVVNYLRPFAIRKSKSSYLTHYAVLENYFKISWRALYRQKTYSAIKIGGFAIGIAACFLISLYIRHELSYDAHYANQDRIYRVLRYSSFNGEPGIGIHLPAPFAEVLRQDYPEVEKAGHYNAVENFGSGSNEVRRVDKAENTHEEGFIFVSQDLLDILEVPFIAGSPHQALVQPNTIVITRQKADKYFPGEDPIGKIIIVNNDEKRQYQVTGVIEEFPVASHLHYDFLMTLSGKEFWAGEQTSWRNQNYIDYVRVRPGADIDALEKKMSVILEKYMLPDVLAVRNNKEEIDWIKNMRFELQPVKDIYLNRVNVSDQLQHGDIRYIWLFGTIATFILIIACINFVNLSTAKSANRAKEVGLRKVVGSMRSSLIQQFLTESIMFSFFAFVIGLSIAWLLLPSFNSLLAKSITFPWQEWWLLPLLGAGTLLIGVVAGIYPSFYLSSFQPAQVLKGKVSQGTKNSTTRSFLVVFQFTISIILIIGTIVINRQMNFILNKNLGYEKEQVLLLQGTHTLGDKIVAFKNALLQLPEVKYASISGYIPIEGAKRNGGGMWKEGMPENEQVHSQHWSIDHDYVKAMGLKIRQGRDFNFQLASDSQAMIINESLAKALQLHDPIGQRIYNWLGAWTVIGVVEDFHFESMKENIQPMGLFIGKSISTISVKANTSDMPIMIESVTKVWKQFSPHQPIRFAFLDQQYARMYDDVERMQFIFSCFALLAIIVACLGLFALSAFMAEQRSKEVSIRLVLGASVGSIFGLLTTNFIKLILLSLIIAVPVAVVMMHEWLNDFAYKVDIGWEVFVLTGCISVLIALLTVSYRSVRAALINPIENLKSE